MTAGAQGGRVPAGRRARKMTTGAFSETDLAPERHLYPETCRVHPSGNPARGRALPLHVSFSSPGDFSSCQDPVEERSIGASREAVCLPPRESHCAEPSSTPLTRKRPSQSGRKSRIHPALGSFFCGARGGGGVKTCGDNTSSGPSGGGGVDGGGLAAGRGQGRGASIGVLSKMETSFLFGCVQQGSALKCTAGRTGMEAVHRAYPFIRFSQAGPAPVLVVVLSLLAADLRPLALRAPQRPRPGAGARGTGARGRVHATGGRALAWSAARGNDRPEQGYAEQCYTEQCYTEQCYAAILATVPAANHAVGIRAARAVLRIPGGPGKRAGARSMLARILGARRLPLQTGALSRGRACPARGPEGAAAPAAGEVRT
jgi:hypothetical protein